jgi:phage terminase large subunit GpA-like protein
VNWDKSEEGEHFPFTAAIYCEKCGAAWDESTRIKIMQTFGKITWRQTRPFVCCNERQEPIKERLWRWSEKAKCGYALCKHCKKEAIPNSHAGFTASKLYSPFITMPELASKWLLSKDDPETKQTFYNTQLGLEYNQETVKQLETHSLSARAEVYNAEVPRGVLVLTAGVDVQSGQQNARLEIEVVGWGLGEESWSVAAHTIQGDPAQPEVWRELDAFLLKGFKFEGGGEMFIKGVCVDSGGHHTDDVYKFARARMGRNVWAIKGANDRPGQKSPVWPIPKLDARKTRLTGYKPVILGTGAAKETLYQKLAVDKPGPGYCHFPPGRPDNWYEQLTAEKQVLEKRHGFAFTRWILPKGRANEALDCRVYAYAALQGLYAVRKLSLTRLAELIRRATGAILDESDELPKRFGSSPEPAAEIPMEQPAAPPRPPPRPAVRRSRFMA